MKYCSHCGSELVDEAVICPKCGCAVPGMIVSQRPAAQLQEREGTGIASLILALVSITLSIIAFFVFGWLSLVAVALSITGLVMGISSYRSSRSPIALTGIILNAVGLILAVVTTILYIITLVVLFSGGTV